MFLRGFNSISLDRYIASDPSHIIKGLTEVETCFLFIVFPSFIIGNETWSACACVTYSAALPSNYT